TSVTRICHSDIRFAAEWRNRLLQDISERFSGKESVAIDLRPRKGGKLHGNPLQEKWGPRFRGDKRILISRVKPAYGSIGGGLGLECCFGMNRNSTGTGDRPMGAQPRILVVDDNDDNLYTLKLHLDLEGYTEIETARDGEEAIARLTTSAFDLVLLDVMMPKVDGFQVLAWLKDQARLRDLPVIMISALTEMNSMARCIELGAVDYLLKPFNPVLLKARLGATLEKKGLRDEIDAHLARLQEELDAARRLQMAMVPQSFPPPSADFPIDLCASMEPAREVGGDLYDFFVTEDGMLCFLVGDVSGKGMAAALFMARTKSLIRIATALMRSRDGPSAAPAEIIARVNRELCQNNGDMMFVTLFFAMLRPSNGEVEFCNAGHNAPYRLNGQGLAPIEGG